MVTRFGDIDFNKDGYTLVVSTDNLLSKDSYDCPREFLFHYNSSITGKPFNLEEAVDSTQAWWSTVYGSNSVKVINSFKLNSNELEGRAFFIITVIPTYLKDNKLQTLRELKNL